MIYDGFERLAAHYDERLKEIDEEICKLIEQRKAAFDNPGFPTDELITTWAKKYDFYENFLNGLFGHLLAEEHYAPAVEPKGFVKNIPVLKSYTKDELFYTVTFIRQYENASVVNLTMDHEFFENALEDDIFNPTLALKVEDGAGTKYTCQNRGGSGFSGHVSFQYVISPPLPEKLTDVKLIFVEEGSQYNQNSKEFEFLIGENLEK